MSYTLKATLDQRAIESALNETLAQVGDGVARVTADSVRVWTGRTRRSARRVGPVSRVGRREALIRTGGVVIAGKDTSDYVPTVYARYPEQYQQALSKSAALINSGEIIQYERQSPDELYLELDYSWR